MTRSNRQDPDAPAADASAEARHGVPRRSSNGSAGRFPELTPCKARDDDTRAEPRGGEPRFSSLTRARFNVNGRDYELTLDPRVTLLDCLRERLGMMGTKKESARPALGPFRQRNLADYHVPVNADIGAIAVSFVEENEINFNPVGVRGIGEIGITGVAGAL